MTSKILWDETFIYKKVTYYIEVDGVLIIVQNVPARVNVETGEKMFSPDTVERLHELVRSQSQPTHTIETPVYEYA